VLPDTVRVLFPPVRLNSDAADPTGTARSAYSFAPYTRFSHDRDKPACSELLFARSFHCPSHTSFLIGRTTVFRGQRTRNRRLASSATQSAALTASRASRLTDTNFRLPANAASLSPVSAALQTATSSNTLSHMMVTTGRQNEI
jgi:hypothetical protein